MSLLLAFLALAPAAHANLLVNPGAEEGAAAADVDDPAAPPPGWVATAGFSQVRYDAADFPDSSDARAVSGGRQFFAGGPDVRSSSATQVVDVSPSSADVDAGGLQAVLAADLGGFGLQKDSARVDAEFRDATGSVLAREEIGPVELADRGGGPLRGFQGYGQTELVHASGRLDVPSGTRSIAVTMTAVRVHGSYDDGYVDNVSLTLEPNELLPSVRRTFLVRRLSGRVAATVRGKRVSIGTAAQLIPVGSDVDARRGSVELTSAANTLGALQTGVFSGGPFRVTQTGGSHPTTELRLAAERCPASGAHAAARRGRLLRGSGRGHFRGRGRSSAATLRGTVWQMSDSCAGTTTSVTRGRVDIHDFIQRVEVPIARGISPDLSFHDTPPTVGGGTSGGGGAPPPRQSGRRAGSSYTAGG